MVLHRTTEVPFTLLWELDSTQSRQSQVDVLGEGNCTFKSVTQGELPAYSPFLYFIHISSLMKWADVQVVSGSPLTPKEIRQCLGMCLVITAGGGWCRCLTISGQRRGCCSTCQDRTVPGQRTKCSPKSMESGREAAISVASVSDRF